MKAAVCLWCRGPLPEGPKPRIFCRDACRRKYQDARRMAERAEERERKGRAAGLMADFFARNDLDEYQRETVFANALMDAAPIIGPGDREETLKKRAVRRPQAEKPNMRHEGKGKTKNEPSATPATKTAWLSLLDLPDEPQAEPWVKPRGWKKNWLTLC